MKSRFNKTDLYYRDQVLPKLIDDIEAVRKKAYNKALLLQKVSHEPQTVRRIAKEILDLLK